jgi:hypothetical protein
MKFGASALVRAVVCSSVVLAACGGPPRRAYIVRLSASDPGRSQLCTTVDAGAGAGEQCVDFTGVDANGDDLAGTLAVSISDIEPSKTYTLEAERTTVGGFSDASAFLTLVFQRAFALTESLTDSLVPKELRGKLDDPDVKAATESVRSSLEGWLGKRGALGKALAQAMSDRPAAAPMAPEDLFDGFFEAGALVDPGIPAAAPYTVFGVGADPPPPRIQVWRADRELAWLATQIADDKKLRATVTTHLERFCSPASFGPVETATAKDFYARLTAGATWATYVKTHEIEAAKIAAALGVTDLAHLRDVLSGKGRIDLAARISAAREANPPTAEQDALLYAIALGHVHRYAAICRANVGVAAVAFAGKADVTARLQALAAELDGLLESTNSAATIVELALEPLIVSTVTQLVDGAVEGTQVTFGPFDIEGGETRMVIKRKETDGDRDVATLTAHGDDSILGLGFTLGAGFAVSTCDSCNVEIVDHVDTDGMAPVRVFTEDRRSTSFEPVVTGQLDVLSWPSLSVGLVLGIPLSEAAGRSNTVITGIGVRIRNKAQIAVGFEWFQTRDLPGEDGDERVELTEPEDQVLTSEQVSTSESAGAFVIAITFARDVL